MPTEVGFAIEPVTRDAGFIANNGTPRTNDTIEQRRLSNVWAANDSNGRDASRSRRTHRVGIDSSQDSHKLCRWL
jgi:hypothetical protein